MIVKKDKVAEAEEAKEYSHRFHGFPVNENVRKPASDNLTFNYWFSDVSEPCQRHLLS